MNRLNRLPGDGDGAALRCAALESPFSYVGQGSHESIAGGGNGRLAVRRVRSG